MKRLLTILFSLCSLVAVAQQNIVIKMSDGTSQTIPAWKVAEMSFVDAPKPASTPAQAIDLGLSVKWASWNIGATTPDMPGSLFGWGNCYSDNHSLNPNYFPFKGINSNIISTDNDIAKTLWGGEWRMPTSADFEELITKCTWTWDAEKKGWTVTGTNSNSIFIPVSTGKREGDAVPSETSKGFYWTGEIDINDNSNAVAYSFTDQKTAFAETSFARPFGLAVRPVYGEYLVPITVSAEEAVVDGGDATVKVIIEGDGHSVEYGIYYSESAAQIRSDKVIKVTKDIAGGTTTTFSFPTLGYNKTIYYQAYAKVGSDLKLEEATHSFTTDGFFKVPEAVDLGIGVKWASWNVGATQVCDYGRYFMWSDPWGAGNVPDIGAMRNISGTQYDIATNAYGDKWRMPTRKELTELFTECDVVWQGGYMGTNVSGVEFKSKTNGNSIFVPLGGVYYPGTNTLRDKDNYGYLWSSELGEGDNPVAYFPQYPIVLDYEEAMKMMRMNIRAVYGEYNPNWKEGKVDPTPGPTPGPDPEPEPEPEPVEPEKTTATAVDLGLSVLWASQNVGAQNKYDTGGYYSWGEVEEKADYDRQYYAYYNNETGLYNEMIGTVINGHRELCGTSYDVARQEMGGTWRMPTNEELEELRDNCTWTWTTTNGASGYVVKSKKNNNSIFLPAAGYKISTSAITGNSGAYWSSTYYAFDDKKRNAYRLSFDSPLYGGSIGVGYENRQFGLTIRAVKAK